MKQKLKKIATIQTGYSFRSKLTSSPGGVALIQMKDVAELVVNPRGLMRTELNDFPAHHLLQRGDILFRTRGLTNTFSILNEDIGPAVLAAPLVRIRTTAGGIMPEYLLWYLNQAPAQSYIASNSRGTAQKMVSQKAIEDIEISVPAIETQRRIVELAELGQKEIEILESIVLKRKQLNSKTLLKIVIQGE